MANHAMIVLCTDCGACWDADDPRYDAGAKANSDTVKRIQERRERGVKFTTTDYACPVCKSTNNIHK